MTKHTPGPWEAYCRDMRYEYGTEWSEENFLQWEVKGPRIPHGRGEYFQADARLIASAPDLLEAAQLCRQYMYEHASNTQDNAFDKLCAAIAKATGEQS